MTDAPLSIGDDGLLRVAGVTGGWLPPDDVRPAMRAQLAAAARVPALEAEIERLRTLLALEHLNRAAAPDPTELRALLDRYYDDTGCSNGDDDEWLGACHDLADALATWLAAVPSTGTDGGGES